MLRAALKALVLAGFGHAPGGARAYRRLTREHLGTFATHVDKLARVWPGYLAVLRTRCGLRFDGLDVWIHDGGETPFSPLLVYLLTGRGGVHTLPAPEGRVLDRYLARAVNGVLAADLPPECVPAERREVVRRLRWAAGAAEALQAVGARVVAGAAPAAIPLPAATVDLCHSGGALEHVPPDDLDAFLGECRRVLRPGGIASHVVDHRDHLHHADARWPFLGHLALPEVAYRLLAGHPLLYHNRLSPSEVEARFRAAGFEKIAVRRLLLPERVYVDDPIDAAARGRPGLPRAWLAAPFRDISEADLRTAAAHYVFRRG